MTEMRASDAGIVWTGLWGGEGAVAARRDIVANRNHLNSAITVDFNNLRSLKDEQRVEANRYQVARRFIYFHSC